MPGHSMVDAIGHGVGQAPLVALMRRSLHRAAAGNGERAAEAAGRGRGSSCARDVPTLAYTSP